MRRAHLLIGLVLLLATGVRANSFGASVTFGGEGSSWNSYPGVNNGYDLLFGSPSPNSWGGDSVTNTLAHDFTASIGGPLAGISAYAFGDASLGILHGKTSVGAWSTDVSGNSYATGPAISTERFWDYLTATNPGGGDVTLRFTNTLDALLDAGGPVLGACNPGLFGAGADIGGTCAMAQSGFLVQIGSAGAWYTSTQSANPAFTGGTSFTDVTVPNGTVIYFEGRLYVASSSCVEGGTGSLDSCINDPSGREEIFTADAANTAIFNVDVLTPGASYTSTSGTDYSTPASAVPEPASLLLLAGGLPGLLGFARRRSRR